MTQANFILRSTDNNRPWNDVVDSAVAMLWNRSNVPRTWGQRQKVYMLINDGDSMKYLCERIKNTYLILIN
jgi:hypothetical protein